MEDFEDIENWSGAQKIQASDEPTPTPENTENNDVSKNKYIYPLIGVLLVAALLGGFFLSQSGNNETETATQEPDNTTNESISSEPTSNSVATTTTATSVSQPEETTPDYSQNPSRNPTDNGEIVVTFANNEAYLRGTIPSETQPFTSNMCLGEKFDFEVENQLIVNDSAPTTNLITIRNESFLFNSDSAELKSDQTNILNSLANTAKQQNFQIEIIGQAKVAGSRAYNHGLAHDRAEAVKNHLLNQGVQNSTIKIQGLGEETDPTNSEQGGNVEIKLTGFESTISNPNCS